MITKTIIKRSKEIAFDKLNPNSIYAVHYALPVEVASEWGVTQEQWGIVATQHTGKLWRAWNVFTKNEWSRIEADDFKDSNCRFFKANDMEAQFAKEEKARFSVEMKMSRLKEAYDNYKTCTNRILAHPLHKFADRLIIFFS